MSDLIEQVSQDIDAMRDELIDLCRSLIRINTVNPYAGAEPTGLEGHGQEHLRPIMAGLGGKLHLFEPPPDIYQRMGVLGPAGRSWRGRPNLVSEFELGDGPTVIVNSHMDTVGVADMTIDPFSAELRDGVIYGRGSTDDKGGMAMGIIAIKAVLKHAARLRGRIVHQSVADEECNGSGAGTLACIDRGFVGDEALVIDGGGLAVMRGCQGVLTANLRVAGKAGHAARGGVSAIDKGFLVKQIIDQIKQSRENRAANALVSLGIFNSGVHPAVVPSSAFLSLNMVYLLEEALAAEGSGRGWGGSLVREQFEAAIVSGADADPWLHEHPPDIEWVKDLIPFETPDSARVVRGMVQAAQQITGSSPSVAIMDAWADAANLARFGHTPAILFGPGTPGKPHSADETVRAEDLVTGAKVVAAYLIDRLVRPA